jgi:membrane protease subunit HflC
VKETDMLRRPIRWLLAGVVVATILSAAMLFALREGRVAVITRLGAPRAVVTRAGLHWKLPWPLERVHVLDGRRRLFDSRFTETLTGDKKNVVLRSFVVWSIADPLAFLQAIGDPATAEDRLDGLVTNAKNAILGRHELSALTSTDPSRLRIVEIEEAILADVAGTARDRFGIRVHQVGFSRLGLPPENVRAVLDQMRAERAQYAARHRAEGERDATVIRAQAEVESASLRADGQRKATEIRGRGEADAARIYADAHRRDPEFYRFLRTLDTLKTLLGRRSTVILRTDAPPFDVLDAGPGGRASGGAAESR